MKRIEKAICKASSVQMSDLNDWASKSNEESGNFKTGRWTKGTLSFSHSFSKSRIILTLFLQRSTNDLLKRLSYSGGTGNRCRNSSGRGRVPSPVPTLKSTLKRWVLRMWNQAWTSTNTIPRTSQAKLSPWKRSSLMRGIVQTPSLK